MLIDAVTVCVGQEYAGYLGSSLERWLPPLRSLTIVTRKGGDPARQFAGGKVRIVETNVFSLFGASFNKGAALCAAWPFVDPSDWVLHFDADIQPPPDWHEEFANANPGELWGARRVDSSGMYIDGDSVTPWGFFQLWHASDRRTWHWPLFEPWHAHAGNYDMAFMLRWPKKQLFNSLLEVIHRGNPVSNWFGPDGDQRLMERIRERGLDDVWQSAKRGERLKVPSPTVRVKLSPKMSFEEARPWLRQAACGGPFGVELDLESPS